MTIIVNICEQDGVFYATSDDMPGFLLVNKDHSALHDDILTAMKALIAIKEKHAKPTAKAKKISRHLVERVELAIAA